MKNKKITPLKLFCVVLTAAFLLCLTTCDMFIGLDRYPLFTSIKKAEQYLKTLGETSPDPDPDNYIGGDHPRLRMKIDLGDLSKPNNNYLKLLSVIETADKYVFLDLILCKMGGTTTFTSYSFDEAPAGVNYIIGLSLPKITKSIKADKNGLSPFFYYKNLKYIGSVDEYNVPIELKEISDSAFLNCKSLIYPPILPVKSIGKNAFNGCVRVSEAHMPKIENIGDYAFYDCGSIKLILGKNPPVLGEGVFLGSTPGDFRIIVPSIEEIDVYKTWIEENASKFNNNGEDIKVYVSISLIERIWKKPN